MGFYGVHCVRYTYYPTDINKYTIKNKNIYVYCIIVCQVVKTVLILFVAFVFYVLYLKLSKLTFSR